MALEFHPGETVEFKVTLYQASGAETDTFDEVAGIEWSVSDPEAVEILDEDAEPRDGQLRVVPPSQPPGEDQFLRCVLDGDPGDGVTEIRLESEPWVVVDGPATGGAVTLQLRQIQPPPPGA